MAITCSPRIYCYSAFWAGQGKEFNRLRDWLHQGHMINKWPDYPGIDCLLPSESQWDHYGNLCWLYPAPPCSPAIKVRKKDGKCVLWKPSTMFTIALWGLDPIHQVPLTNPWCKIVLVERFRASENLHNHINIWSVRKTYFPKIKGPLCHFSSPL